MTLGKFLHQLTLGVLLHEVGPWTHEVTWSLASKLGPFGVFTFQGNHSLMTPGDQRQLGLRGRLGCLAVSKLHQIMPLARPPGKSA